MSDWQGNPEAERLAEVWHSPEIRKASKHFSEAIIQAYVVRHLDVPTGVTLRLKSRISEFESQYTEIQIPF